MQNEMTVDARPGLGRKNDLVLVSCDWKMHTTCNKKIRTEVLQAFPPKLSKSITKEGKIKVKLQNQLQNEMTFDAIPGRGKENDLVTSVRRKQLGSSFTSLFCFNALSSKSMSADYTEQHMDHLHERKSCKQPFGSCNC